MMDRFLDSWEAAVMAEEARKQKIDRILALYPDFLIYGDSGLEMELT